MSDFGYMLKREPTGFKDGMDWGGGVCVIKIMKKESKFVWLE